MLQYKKIKDEWVDQSLKKYYNVIPKVRENIEKNDIVVESSPFDLKEMMTHAYYKKYHYCNNPTHADCVSYDNPFGFVQTSTRRKTIFDNNTQIGKKRNVLKCLNFKSTVVYTNPVGCLNYEGKYVNSDHNIRLNKAFQRYHQAFNEDLSKIERQKNLVEMQELVDTVAADNI